MTAKSPSHLVPKLRFPEFQDDPEWEERKLGDLLKVNYGKDHKNLEEGEIPVFGTGGVMRHVNKALSRGPAIVIGRKGTIDKPRFVEGPFWTVDTLFYCIPNEGTEPLFLFWNIQRINWLKYNEATGVPSLSAIAIKSVPVATTNCPAEQQKIADCLGSLDDLIAAVGRKLEALRQHKQGLMQQLFPKAGETVPKLRFPEFRNAPEWEEKELGDVSEVLMCKRIYASQTNPNGGVPFYKIGTLEGVPDAFISKGLFEEYKSKYNFPRPGEILITCSGTVGKCLAYDGTEAYFQDSNIVWIDNPMLEVSNEFLLSILSNVNWSTLNSTTITRIYGTDLRGLAIMFPHNEQEQKRIADFLFKLDSRLAAQVQKLNALKMHKQGLMRQLFPSLERH